MSCFLEEKAGEIRAVLSFKRDQLLYDVANYAYIEGSVLQTDDSHSRHMVQDACDEGNIDRMTRVLDLAVAKCREILYAYTKHDVHKAELDDRLKDTAVYGIVLSVPSGFSQTTLNLLERLIHEYLVCECVADWMSISNPEKYSTWKGKSEDALSELRVCLMTRMSRVRRRIHPF